MTLRHAGLALAGLLAAGSAAQAHPHVLVDARAEVVFDGDARITAVRHIWQFDEAFTAFAVQGLDADEDGQLTDDELAPLAKINVESLQEFDFFTWLTVGDETFSFVPPNEYWLEFHGGRLTLFYTLPLAAPVALGPDTTLEVFDPEYFVAFTFAGNEPVTLVDAPAGCAATYRPPRELDAASMAILGAVPADQPDLPPNLQQMASVLANLVTIACPGATAAAYSTPADPPASSRDAANALATGTLTAVDRAASPDADEAAARPGKDSPSDAAASADATGARFAQAVQSPGDIASAEIDSPRADGAGGGPSASKLIILIAAGLMALVAAAIGFFALKPRPGRAG